MNNEDIHGPEPEDTSAGSGLPMPKGKQAFQYITRELSDDDLTNPAVLKLLLEERDILANENAELRSYQAQFHGADKKVAVLEEKNKTHLEERDILANESAELKSYQAQFHETDKKVAVLEEKNKTHLVAEILSGVCFTIGAAMLGYAPVLWKSQPSGWIALVFGLVLIIGGIFAKAVKR